MRKLPNLACNSWPVVKFIVSPFRDEKPQFWINFDIWEEGLLYTAAFTHEGQIWYARADPQSTLTCQISSRSVYSVAFWWRKPQILPFFGLLYFVVSPVGSDLTKWTRMYNNKPSPIWRYQNRFYTVLQRLCDKIVRTNSVVQNRDGHTNRQTRKNSTFWQPRQRV